MIGQKVGYARVSSEDQNLDRQLEALRTLNLDRLFTDKLSGKNLERAQLQAMLSHVREGDQLFVHSMDRLARNLGDLIQTVKDLTGRGVSVSFIKENLNFNGDRDEPMAHLMLGIMGAVAQFERALLRSRQAEGIRIAKEKGVYKGRIMEANCCTVATATRRA